MGITVGKVGATGKEWPYGTVKCQTMYVKKMWDTINSLSPQKLPDAHLLPAHIGWKTVRVFVSSTFEDFHSERDVLVKRVFPELREWCEAHRMCLVECDLRWGIPQDTPSGQIFSTCLEELDRCHQDTLGKPFMVILLGERAGWIPDVAEVPREIVEKYPWVHGMSVTGTEILHGAYINSNPNAAFCLRSPSFLAQLPSHDLPRYQQKGWSALMLQSLKEQVWKRFPKEQILTYDCQLLGTDSSTGVDKVKLGFSDEFCAWILKFLQTRILQTFHEESEMLQAEEPSWDQTEKAQHQLFLWQKNQVFLGRELEVQRILEFLHVDPADLKQQSNKPEHKWTEEGAINPGIPLYEVIGEPGLGKSSLIAACINKAIELPCSTVFYHFIGCCPSSVQLSNIVMRLCCHLMPSAQGLDEILLRLKNHSGNEEIKDILQKALAAAPISKDMVLYIFIDGINQLSVPSDVSEFLSWLSTEGFLSPFCRCVISRTPRSVSVQSAYNLHLEPLPLESAQRLAVSYLSRYNKTLSPEQIHLLMQKTTSQNPLWLSMSCEELRVFGEFKMITQKISELPDTLQGLLESIIKRLVVEDQTARVKELLCLMQCCSEGITERDLKGSLSKLEGSSELPTMHWATLRRTLRFLLRVGRDHKGRDTLSFFHASMEQAVKQCFLGSDDLRQPYLLCLSDYYEYSCTDDVTVVHHLPRLLQEAKQNGRLVQFLRKDLRALSIQAHTRAQYLKALRCSQVCREGFPRMPALICQFCSLKTGAFGQLFLNRQSCVICGSHVFNFGKESFLCLQHYRPGRNECLICKSSILGPQAPSPALLCHLCGIFLTCIALKI